MALCAALQLRLFVVVTLLLLVITVLAESSAADNERKVYIAYMGVKPSDGYTTDSRYKTESLHLSLLEQILDNSLAKESLVYSYGKSFHGFAAKLTAKEKQKLASREGIISVFPSKILQLHTTRSWDFLGFTGVAREHVSAERDVIIGMLDTGIWSSSMSFHDEGLSAPPAKWKGTCQAFACNNKIIGARYYYANTTKCAQEISALDYEGHGTHTASTVAGREVNNASLYGIANGTIRGAVPYARIAMYKVCWGDEGCADHDILAAFDDAISDGVDIISVSMGLVGDLNYFADSIAIGSFHAMKAGILTVASAGNAGPHKNIVSNTAPWILTVAASTIDRRLVDRVVIDDQEIFEGNSINTHETGESFPLIYAGACDANSIREEIVNGKIMLCDARIDGGGPLRANAKGVVMIDWEVPDPSWRFPLPAAVVNASEGDRLRNVVSNNRNLMANIHKTCGVKDDSAPTVASFSSRGPSRMSPDVLKPDISAPGVNILSAWSPLARVSDDKQSVNFNIMSGTSVSCPHVSGIAAYVKSFHPEFYPAAIMSAIITTATFMNPSINPETELAYGAGQINPTKAIDPGLVYDARIDDYIEMLCSLNYDNTEIQLLSGDNTSNCNSVRAVKDLNYPTMSFRLQDKTDPYTPYAVNFSRTVTNVGNDSSATYIATIETTYGRMKVAVYPDVLTFTPQNDKQSFVVSVSSDAGFLYNETDSAYLIWDDGIHYVKSPIVIHYGFMEV